MSFWDDVSGFLDSTQDVVGSLADTYSALGQAGLVDVGPSAGGTGGYGGTPYGQGYSFPPPSMPFMGSSIVDPGAPSPSAETPAFVWIAGAVALVWLVKK